MPDGDAYASRLTAPFCHRPIAVATCGLSVERLIDQALIIATRTVSNETNSNSRYDKARRPASAFRPVKRAGRILRVREREVPTSRL